MIYSSTGVASYPAMIILLAALLLHRICVLSFVADVHGTALHVGFSCVFIHERSRQQVALHV